MVLTCLSCMHYETCNNKYKEDLEISIKIVKNMLDRSQDNLVTTVGCNRYEELPEKVSVGDEFVLHSQNGLSYTIVIVSVNENNEPNVKYTVNVYDENRRLIDIDAPFCGDALLRKCYRKD